MRSVICSILTVLFVSAIVIAKSPTAQAASQGGEPTQIACRGVGAACDDAKDSAHWCCTTPRTLQCVNHRCR